MPLFHTFEMLIRMELCSTEWIRAHTNVYSLSRNLLYLFCSLPEKCKLSQCGMLFGPLDKTFYTTVLRTFQNASFQTTFQAFFLKVISAFNNTVFFFYQDLKKTCLYYLYAMVGMKYENSSMPKVSTTLQMHNTFIVQLFLNITVTLKIATLVIGASKS